MEYSPRIQILLQFNRMYAFRDSLTENGGFGKENWRKNWQNGI